PEEQEVLAVGEDDDGDSAQETVALDRTQRHSSAGISFAVRTAVADAEINIFVTAARYEPFWLDKDGNRTTTAGTGREKRWQRKPVDVEIKGVRIGVGTPDKIPLEPYGVPSLMLRLHAAPITGAGNEFAVTVVLVNMNDEATVESRREREEQLFF